MGERPPGYPHSGGNGSGPPWARIISVLLGLAVIGMLVLVVGLSSLLEEEESARISAEEEAAEATTQRDEAISGANDAIARANQETIARATAEAEQSEAEQQAQEETRLRATAEAEQSAAEQRAQEETRLRATAEAGQLAAGQLAQEETRRRATAEAKARQSERQRATDHTAAERELVLELARTSPTIKAIATGELKVHFEPLPWYAGENAGDGLQDVIESLDGRNHHGARIQLANREEDADIYVRWVRDYGDHVLGRAVHQTVIHVGLGSTNCNDEWQAFDRNTVVKIVWHELGHTLGYGHSDDPNNIMYPTTETRFEIERDIDNVLSSGWWWTIPFCAEGEYHYSIETDERSHGFEIAVLRPGTTGEDFTSGSGRTYSGCGNGEWQAYSDTCDIGFGSSLYIHNSQGDAIRLSGQIIRLDQPEWPDMQWDEDAFYYDDETLDYYRELFAEG